MGERGEGGRREGRGGDKGWGWGEVIGIVRELGLGRDAEHGKVGGTASLPTPKPTRMNLIVKLSVPVS